MARKRKELPVLTDITITGVAAEGNSIARHNDMVIFIPFGAPGDVADVKIDRKRRTYAEGHIVNLKTPSPVRVEPRCSHFTICGGCRWQHLP
ncbi:MAG: TRAM domain-containing protein, partial [Muribaculaceae bacterium]|nr:TRAM domain-containing protein [Muribaculaceae bacterium]